MPFWLVFDVVVEVNVVLERKLCEMLVGKSERFCG